MVFALITAVLYSTQAPFFGEAARQLSAAAFVGLTQVALLFALPFMLARGKSRTDFVAIFRNRALYGKLAAILALGVVTIFCLIFGLRGANPIVVAAILNLSPFWAALIAKFVSGNKIPISPALFFSCFVAAFVGAALIAFSQNGAGWADILKSFGQATWLLALPLPVLTALSGTLVGQWFGEYEEFAAIAANFPPVCLRGDPGRRRVRLDVGNLGFRACDLAFCCAAGSRQYHLGRHRARDLSDRADCNA